MMTRVLLTFLVGIVVSLGTTAAVAETFVCKRYTDDTLGFTTYSAFESWFPKSISLDIYGWKSRSGYKALTKEENRKKYRLLPNGKMIAGMKPNPGFKTVDNVRYKCDRTSLQWTAGLERKSGDTQAASASSSASYSSNDGLCNMATRDGSWETGDFYKSYVQEAKRRGLSCGVGETSSSARITTSSLKWMMSHAG